MKKLKSVFSNFNKKLLIIVLLFFITLVMTMSSVSTAGVAYETYTNISVNTTQNVGTGLSFDITGNLTDSSTSGGIGGKNITVNITDRSNSSNTYANSSLTETNGSFVVPFNINVTGSYDCVITFAGDTNRNCSPASVKMPIVVKKLATYFVLEDIQSSGLMQLVLFDENLNTLNGVIVSYSDNRGTPPSGQIITGTLGNFSYTAGGFANNMATVIQMNYSGNATHAPSSFIIAMDQNVIIGITINPTNIVNITTETVLIFTGTVYERAGTGGTVLSNISLFVENQLVNIAPLNLIGTGTYNFTLPFNNISSYAISENLEIMISVMYATSGGQARNLSFNQTINVFPAKIPTYIEFSRIYGVEKNTNYTIYGTLYNSSGQPILGVQNVDIYIDGVFKQTVQTDSNGRFNFTFNNDSAGDHNITAVFNDTSYYYYFNITLHFEVEREPSIINVGNNTTIVNDSAIIYGNLTDQHGNLITGEWNMSIYINDTFYTYVTVVNGIFNVTILPRNIRGDYLITARFEGNIEYNRSSGDGWLFVLPINTTTHVDSNNGTATEPLNITGNLTDQNGNPIPNADIEIYIDGTFYMNTTTDTNGRYNVSFTPGKNGTYNVTAFYRGNDTYNESNGTNLLTINRMPTNTTVNSNTGTATEPLNITGNLTDQNGNPIPNADIEIYIDGVPYMNTTTDTNGRYNVSFTPGKNGTYNVTAFYRGNDTYNESNGTNLLTINRMPTNTTVSAHDGTPTQTINITVTLKNQHGIDINGTMNITITSPNGYYESFIVIVNGSYTFSRIFPNIGNYTVTAVYSGNETYVDSNGNNAFTIAEIATIISVSNGTYNVTDPYTINGTLVYTNGTIVNITGNVIISINGTDYVVQLIDGVFTYSNTSYSYGNYTVDVRFVSDGTYAGSNATGWLNILRLNTTTTLDSGIEIIYHYRTNFTAYLHDERNRPIAGALIHFWINISGSEIYVGNATTDSYGKAVVPYDHGSDIGPFNVRAVYDGNLTYVNSNVTQQVNSRELEISIIIENITVKVLRNAKIRVYVIDEFGAIVSNANISVEMNGTTRDYLTDGSGMFYLDYIPDIARNIPIIASHVTASNPHLRTANPFSYGTLSVLALDTSILLKNVVVTALQDATVSATLVDEDGRLLSNMTVDIYIDGEYYGNATTDAYGRIYLNLGSRSTGVYTITATFPGSSYVWAGTVSDGTLTVRPLRTSIFVSAIHNESESTTFVARLYNEFNKPVADRPVAFFLNGQFIGIAVTNSNGIAILPYSYTPNGIIVAEFLGDGIYRESLDNRPFGLNPVDNINDTAVLDPVIKGDLDDYIDSIDIDGTDDDDNESDEGQPISAIAMLDTGNPIAMLVLIILCVFLIGIRKKQKN
ncbi:MAG: Ig-like domain repeat protein [Methanobrevibacter sp.]|nr:Ig-like domain repeat protein [Methanobrevibacter sp.]